MNETIRKLAKAREKFNYSYGMSDIADAREAIDVLFEAVSDLVHESQERVAVPPMLTNEHIDSLSNADLWRAVQESCRPGFNAPPLFGSRVDEAFGLLARFDGVTISLDNEDEGIRVCMEQHHNQMLPQSETLAVGPKVDAAAVMCRAYLKLVNNTGDSDV